jgi:hypothetical protein
VVLASCGSEEGFVQIRNDLDRSVEVLKCKSNACDDFRRTEELGPGASFPASVSTSGVPNPWFVRELDGRPIGCLPLVVPEPMEGLVADVSNATTCSNSYDEEEFWPPRTSTLPADP